MYKAWGEFISNASNTEHEVEVLYCDENFSKKDFIKRITKFLSK